MPIREIPRQRWPSFLDRFSREHAARLCTLEVDSSFAGSATEATFWPLLGLTCERCQDGLRVQVFVGDRIERHLGHALSEPRHVFLDETDDGAHLGLLIEADEGSIRLRFRTPHQPDQGEPDYIERYLP